MGEPSCAAAVPWILLSDFYHNKVSKVLAQFKSSDIFPDFGSIQFFILSRAQHEMCKTEKVQMSTGESSAVGDLSAPAWVSTSPCLLWHSLTSQHNMGLQRSSTEEQQALPPWWWQEQGHDDCILISRTCTDDKICQSTTASSRGFVLQRRIAVTLMSSSNCALFVLVEYAYGLFLNAKRNQKQRNSSNGCLGPWFLVTSEKPGVLVTDVLYVYEHKASSFIVAECFQFRKKSINRNSKWHQAPHFSLGAAL